MAPKRSIQVGFEGGIAVDLDRFGSPVRPHISLEPQEGFRMKLAGDHFVLWPKEGRGDQGRARIARRVGADQGPDAIQIGLDQRLRFAPERARQEAQDPTAPFRCLLRALIGEIVKAFASVRIDDAKRRLFQREINQNARQDDMFENVSEIAGVKDVAIVHSYSLSHRSNSDILRPAGLTGDLRTRHEVAHVLRQAEANLRQFTIDAFDRHHPRPQARIGRKEGALNVERCNVLLRLLILERRWNDDQIVCAADIGEIGGRAFAGTRAVLAPFIAGEPDIWIKTLRRIRGRATMDWRRRNRKGNPDYIAATSRGRQSRD